MLRKERGTWTWGTHWRDNQWSWDRVNVESERRGELQADAHVFGSSN